MARELVLTGWLPIMQKLQRQHFLISKRLSKTVILLLEVTSVTWDTVPVNGRARGQIADLKICIS